MADRDRIARIVREVAGRYPSAASAEAPEAKPAARPRSVALGADHGGLALKNLLRGYLEDLGYAVKEMLGGVTGWLDEGLSLVGGDAQPSAAPQSVSCAC